MNTPLKPPTQNKDGQQSNGMPNRKISVSNNFGTPGALPSPSATRVPGRRRETSESYPFPSNPLASPTEGRAASPPPSLLRRRTDIKEQQPKPEEREDKPAESSTPFGTLKRSTTGPFSAGLGGPSSPWASTPQSAGFGVSPMGAFGNFALGTPSAAEKRPGLGGGRAESRFKGLMSKESNEDMGNKTIRERASNASLSKVNESDAWHPQEPVSEAEEELAGSAALGGQDVSPPHPRQGFRGFGTPSRSDSRDDFGFAAFGMTSSDAGHGFGQGTMQTPFQQQRHQGHGNEPMSPTDTNPYRSPEQAARMDQEDGDTDGSDSQNAHLPGLGPFGQHSQEGLGGLGALPNLGRNQGQPGSDRSQTSSTGPNRGFPTLGGLGNLPGIGGPGAWPVSQGGLGTPGRQTAGLSAGPFGGGIFNTVGEMQSPSLAGLGGNMFGGQAGNNVGAGAGNRLGSLFPPAMQEQMRGVQEGEEGNEQQDLGLGMERATRENEQTGPAQPPSSASNQPPAAQQRTMVMPDRMRWIYRDPQGVTQGPWSGLEMHDWYKAGFFSPELLVKKYEDPDYEPLAQLIRRIGNSREPFLVPQIGIPHGPPAATPGNAWAGAGPLAAAGPTSSSAAQPPFASSFPSFGTTLTAEQQNALERRKQEEQYLMARQKEHLAQAQIAQRLQLGGPHGMLPQQLHHHSSAQSLHSQPSFGSITSPTAYQPSPIQGPTQSAQGFFDNSFRAAPGGGLGAVGAGVDSLGHIREEEIPGIMDRLNLGRGQQAPFGAPGQPFNQQTQERNLHEQQVQTMLNDRARLQQEQAGQDPLQQFGSEQSGQSERLRQFQELQAQADTGLDQRFKTASTQPIKPPSQQQQEQRAMNDAIAQGSNPAPLVGEALQAQVKPQEHLSLTEQVQKAASAKHSPAQQPSPWGKVDTTLPQPFPPAPSQSPLPAPAAQRTSRQSVADALHAESRSRSQTPSLDTPSAAIAPWAKESAEAAKGPSLKEIQMAEAKKAAEVEELASAARRAAFEKEMMAQAQNVAPAPGLPLSSKWATASPATPTSSVPAAWAKTAQKPASATTAKSMAQIQKEEEARKKKLAAVAQAQVAAIAGVSPVAGGKRYADLASKITSPPQNVGGAWTTVGASGKTKTPAPVLAAPPAGRVVSSGVVPTMAPGLAAAKKTPSRSSTLTSSVAVNAQEEFRKWAVSELKQDLSKGISGK